MKDKKEAKKGLSRRDFVKTTAIAAGATALAELGSKETKAQEPPFYWWNKIVDVVVVGYGGAGAAAAIAAHDAGAKVLILEKWATGGGSTYYSGGYFVSPRDVEGAVQYLMYCARAANGEYYEVDENLLRAWAQAAVQNEPWIQSLGTETAVVLRGWYNVEGATSYTSCQVRPISSGVGLWKVLSDAITARNIEVMYETEAVELITRGGGHLDPFSKQEVLGVLARSGGRQIGIKARRAVILTCGGFDYDETMKKNFLKAYPKYSVGHPGNTGDAIRLAAKTGADLWHMNNTAGNLCHKFDEVPVAYPSMLQLGAAGRGVIFVSKYGKRFTNEETTYDAVEKALDQYDSVRRDYPNIPCWCIFDEKSRLRGPVGLSVPIGNPIYGWSADNSAEIARGWIVQADTVLELGTKIGVDPYELCLTVSTFNQYCAQGYDPDFGRTIGLIPINNPPYYAVKGYPGVWGTAGGPRINTKAQVIKANGQRVPRLYAAGNASGFAFPFLYPLSGTAIGDAFAVGRIAGSNAAAETPWS